MTSVTLVHLFHDQGDLRGIPHGPGPARTGAFESEGFERAAGNSDGLVSGDPPLPSTSRETPPSLVVLIFVGDGPRLVHLERPAEDAVVRRNAVTHLILPERRDPVSRSAIVEDDLRVVGDAKDRLALEASLTEDGEGGQPARACLIGALHDPSAAFGRELQAAFRRRWRFWSGGGTATDKKEEEEPQVDGGSDDHSCLRIINSTCCSRQDRKSQSVSQYRWQAVKRPGSTSFHCGSSLRHCGIPRGQRR